MKFTTPALLLPLLAYTSANPFPITRADNKPPYFITTGNSTVVTGGGFLSFVISPADGENRAKSGTTTETWRANGCWDGLLENINKTVFDYETIVAMQFGHNDQKGLSLDYL
ncbi:uncharacterized protein BDV17DRAFT_294564 [Aspergillus undulatus]|uniref:uncharacterized protein n=1 Tax=Aspergillus undulatus TaxID=1810928 RepID=UPI003CCCB04D